MVATPTTTPLTKTPGTPCKPISLFISAHTLTRIMSAFDRQKHIGYFATCLRKLPGDFGKLDTNRLTIVHFCVHALDLLGVWEPNAQDLRTQLQLNPRDIITWIRSLQIATDDLPDKTKTSYVGFLGGTFLGGSFTDPTDQPWHFHQSHIAMTYTALTVLKVLSKAIGDEEDWLQGIDRVGIVKALQFLQHANGSFECVHKGGEHDMRFLYCACCISHMLHDWSGVNIETATTYIQSCRSHDGAIALLPGQEGHGGSTFCAIASLQLMNKLDDVLDQNEWREELTRWCVTRQVGGMQGRPNKAEDTCYSFWIGGTLRLLGQDDLLDHQKLRDFVMKCQTKMGGFSKVIGVFPDPLHSYYSLAYLSLSQQYFAKDSGSQDENLLVDEYSIQLKELNCTLGISMDAATSFSPVHP